MPNLRTRLNHALAATRATAAAPLGRFAADARGTVIVIAAILFPVVVGGLGLGVETSYWYLTQRKLQHAADLAAHAANARNRAGDPLSGMEAAALHVAQRSGLPVETGVLELFNPPETGDYAGDPDSVEVVLTETRGRWFTSVFVSGPVSLQARAVTQIRNGATACILATAPTESGAITVSGSTSVTLENCDVAANSLSSSAFDMGGTSASMSTGCVHTVGQANVNSGLTLTECETVNEFAPAVRDPYRDVAEPALSGPCENGKVGQPNNTTTVTPTHDHPSGVPSRRYCKGLDVKGNVTFAPGLYIVEGGDLTFNGGSVDSEAAVGVFGEGVTFYLAGSAGIRLNGNVELDLSAPSSGPYSGILFFGSRSASGVTHKINGAPGSTLEGAVYAPASDIEFTGNSSSTGGCTQVVGYTVTMTGNSTLGSSCADAGTSDILANEGIVIVE